MSTLGQCWYNTEILGQIYRIFPRVLIYILLVLFSTKPKEVGRIKLISLRQISDSIALKYIINNSVLK